MEQADIPPANADAEPRHGALYCQWIWQGATILCDGTVTCGLDDPFKTRDHGSLHTSTLREILDGAAIAARRAALLSGKACSGCSMYEMPTPDSNSVMAHPPVYPRRLIVEPSIKCNIRCDNETCNVANAKDFVLRAGNFLDVDLFRRLMDEAGIHADELYLYNYGEPFLHPRIFEMLAYARSVNPRLHVTTSTNGIMLAKGDRAERIVREQLVDAITFTIAGVDQESYGRYHKAASFADAIGAMRRMSDEKRRLGADRPTIHWRYLLFDWNDSDRQIAEAVRLQSEIGVDRFSFMLTGSPLDGRSLRRAPGTPGFAALAPWLDYQEGFSVDPFAEAGLWGREHGEGRGDFAWTGRRARVFVQPRDGRLALRFARGGTEAGAMPRIVVRLPWGEVDAMAGRNDWETCIIPLPPGYGGGPVRAEIEVDRLFTPMRHGETWGDSRELGVMLSLVDVVPAPNPYRAAAAVIPAARSGSIGIDRPLRRLRQGARTAA